MSTRKIIFLILIGVSLLAGLFFLWKVSQSQATRKAEKVNELSIWVVWGTTEQYNSLFADFGKYAPDYSRTKLSVRIFSDYKQYRRVLLSTLADGKWPDIFQVEALGDDILEKQIAPIPEEYIDIKDFEKKYEDIFLPLLTETGSKSQKTRSIKGIPLGYETLGIFYNKSLLRSLPKTWNDVSLMYSDASLPGVLPINIGMWPRFVPDATDIVWYFLLNSGVSDYSDAGNSNALSEYGSYKNSQTQSTGNDNPESDSWRSLASYQGYMETEKLSTLDLFMRGKIAMIVGFPSAMTEIEKSYKRAGNEATEWLILTERLPESSLGTSSVNIARYRYLGVSSKSAYQVASAKLLEYLGTPSAREKTLELFPYLISPEKSYYTLEEQSSLSKLFAKAKMWPFIPYAGQKIQLFHYGEKSIFEEILWEELDRNEKIDNNLLSKVSSAVKCEIETLENKTVSESCQK